MDKYRRVLGEDDPSTLWCILDVGGICVAQRKHAEGIELLAPIAIKVRQAAIGTDAWRLAVFLNALGKARTARGEFAAAEADLLEAYPINVKTDGASKKGSFSCGWALIDLYTTWDKADPGKGHNVKAEEWRAKLPKEIAPVPREAK